MAIGLDGPMFESKQSDIFKSITNKEGAHYNIFSVKDTDGIEALKRIFPDGHADELNLCLFSTSGVHGLYNSIDESEKAFNRGSKDEPVSITYLIIHPRLVCMRYGNCEPSTKDDYIFLRKLMDSSHKNFLKIGLK